mmetsp:Transcript_75199/g.174364  ORF Transcript_75199/g.174364 Transcript_75199/m.174364 type:complete len:83 (-) Transcript_75199:108-356(-)
MNSRCSGTTHPCRPSAVFTAWEMGQTHHGRRVRLHNLWRMTELNGARGRLVFPGWPDPRRWLVDLGEAGSVFVRPENVSFDY